MKIFAVYKTTDNLDLVWRIHDSLIQKYGQESVIMAADEIVMGRDIRSWSEKIIKKCTLVLVFIDENFEVVLANPSEIIRIELEKALQSDVPIIPIFIQKNKVILLDKLPEVLRDIAFLGGVQIRSDPDYQNDIKRLFAGVDSINETNNRRAFSSLIEDTPIRELFKISAIKLLEFGKNEITRNPEVKIRDRVFGIIFTLLVYFILLAVILSLSSAFSSEEIDAPGTTAGFFPLIMSGFLLGLNRSSIRFTLYTFLITTVVCSPLIFAGGGFMLVVIIPTVFFIATVLKLLIGYGEKHSRP